MASFIDMLNQGIGNVTGTPLGQLGINLMMQAGPQAGNPGAGVRMGQAFGGMQQMQQQQQQLEYQKMLRETQQGELAFRKSKIEQEAAQRDRLKQLVRDNPDMITNPMVRTMLGEFGDPAMAEQIGKLQGGAPKVGAMPFESQVTLPDGSVQMQRVNPQTFQYEPVGQPYRPTAQQSVDQRGAQNTATNAFKERDLKLEQERNAQAATRQAADAQRAQALATDAQRKQQAAQLKNLMSSKDLESKYKGVTSQFDENIAMVDELLAHPGLEKNFGTWGQIPSYPGSDASNFGAKLEQFRAKAGLTGLTQLKEQGVVLTPVSNVDLSQTTNSVINMTNKQSAEQARGSLTNYRKTLMTARDEAGKNYGQMQDLYKVDTTAPSTMSKSYAKPTTEAEFNALKPGTVYIDPDDGKPYVK